MSGIEEFPPVGDVGLGQLAVGAFFAISGFLIARSRVSLPGHIFLWHRALRIFPAFVVRLVVVPFVFAPLSTMLTGRDWEPMGSVSYVGRNLGLWIFQPGVADTLPPVAFPWWNGSLWTLFYEFAAYLAAGALLTSSVARRHRAVMAFGPWPAHAGTDARVRPARRHGRVLRNTLHLGTYFVAGMALWAISDRLRVSHLLALIAAGVTVVLVQIELVALLGPLPIAYLCLWAGATLPTRIGASNDISYGMYVYAFPVEQVLALGGFGVGGLWGFSIAATVLTVPFAWASWLLVEQPAMRFKHVFTPSRRHGRETRAPGTAPKQATAEPRANPVQLYS